MCGKEADSVTEQDSAVQRNLPLWKPPIVLSGFLSSLETSQCLSPLADLNDSDSEIGYGTLSNKTFKIIFYFLFFSSYFLHC